MNNISDRDFGNLEGRVNALEKTHDKFEKDVRDRLDNIDSKLETVINIQTEQRGGFKTMVIIASISGFVVSMLSFALDKLI